MLDLNFNPVCITGLCDLRVTFTILIYHITTSDEQK